MTFRYKVTLVGLDCLEKKSNGVIMESENKLHIFKSLQRHIFTRIRENLNTIFTGFYYEKPLSLVFSLHTEKLLLTSSALPLKWELFEV